jgi:hypothetical protein
MLYVFCVCLGFTEYLVAMIVSTIHMMFTEPLSATDLRQYVSDNARAPAEPLMWFVCAAFWHVIATTILFQSSFGETGRYYILWILLGVIWLIKVWCESSSWKPRQTTGERADEDVPIKLDM